MAKAPTRKPVTERGVSLLALIAASSVGYLFLAQDEGADIVTAGQASIKTDVEAPAGLAAVELTDAGRAFLAEHQSEVVTPAAVTAKPSYEIEDDVAMPTEKARTGGRQFQYPFDKLNVGQSFHVAKSAANPDPAARLASSVSGARTRFSVEERDEAGNVINETVKVSVYSKDAAGKFVMVDGKRVKTGETDVTRPKMKIVRDFNVRAVDATDPKGEGARVWRTA